MRIWGLELEIAILLFGFTYPLVLAPLVHAHYRRFRTFAGWPALVTTATFFYACGLVAFTFFPLPVVSADFVERHESLRHWHFVPFQFVPGILEKLRSTGLIHSLTSRELLVEVFNVILTMPLGFLVAYRYRRGLGFAAAVGFGVSLMIEVTQGTGIFGIYPCPYRLAEVDDLIMNTLGAFLGAMLGAKFGGLLPDPNPPPSPSPARLTVRRRGTALVLDLLIVTIFAAFAEILAGLAAWQLSGDRQVLQSPWFRDLELMIGAVLPTFLLFLVLPLVRSDRATPGQICVMLRPHSIEGSDTSSRAVAIRFAVRWLPWLAAVIAEPALAFPLLVLVELGTVLWRKDRRSLSSVAAGIETAIQERSSTRRS